MPAKFSATLSHRAEMNTRKFPGAGTVLAAWLGTACLRVWSLPKESGGFPQWMTPMTIRSSSWLLFAVTTPPYLT